MADCVVALCRQPALPDTVLVEIGGGINLELPLCAIDATEVRKQVDYLHRVRADFFDGC